MAGQQASSLADLSDEELVRHFQAGEDREQAYMTLFERYVGVTHGFFRRRIGDADTASDLNQELHTTIYTKLDGFRGESSYRTWLFRLARNSLSRLRQRWRVHVDETPTEVEDHFWEGLSSSASDPMDELERRRRAGALKLCLARLSDVERFVVVSQYYEDKTLKEITRELQLSNPSGARAPLISAQRKLRRCLERAGVIGAEGTGGQP